MMVYSFRAPASSRGGAELATNNRSEVYRCLSAPGGVCCFSPFLFWSIELGSVRRRRLGRYAMAARALVLIERALGFRLRGPPWDTRPPAIGHRPGTKTDLLYIRPGQTSSAAKPRDTGLRGSSSSNHLVNRFVAWSRLSAEHADWCRLIDSAARLCHCYGWRLRAATELAGGERGLGYNYDNFKY